MKLKILVAEDDASLNKLYETVLVSRGYKVVTAHNGEEALRAAGCEDPDVILLDIMMPEIHGLNVLEVLKSDPKTKHIDVIMITALDDQATKKKALNNGARDYIIKSQSSMNDIIRKIIEVTS